MTGERIEIKRSKDGLHHYIVKIGKNGEPLWTSEMYTRHFTAVEAAFRERGDSGILVIDTTREGGDQVIESPGTQEQENPENPEEGMPDPEGPGVGADDDSGDSGDGESSGDAA